MSRKDRPRTLAVDIGGTGIKAARLGPDGGVLGKALRVETPGNASPSLVLDHIDDLSKQLGEFERIGCGFPGVIREGKIWTAVHLGEGWIAYALEEELERRFKTEARVANDADVQGLAVIEGRGSELVLTLGTGLGSALFREGRLYPNTEFGHLPFEDSRSMEQILGDACLAEHGVEAWFDALQRAVQAFRRCFVFDRLYLGGGNARLLTKERLALLGEDVQAVSNEAGLRGAARLFDDR